MPTGVTQPKIRWGVLGAANIALKKVVPGMKGCERSEVVALASRDLRKAESAAKELGLRRAYGSYEELLADREIDAIYNPLPNHLHLPWSRHAASASVRDGWRVASRPRVVAVPRPPAPAGRRTSR